MRSSLAILGAFMRRDWAIDTSYRAVFALSVLRSVFTLALFFYLSEVVDDQQFAATEEIDGSYFGFVAIGIATFTIVQSSMIAFSSKLREEQTTGTFEALMTTPANPSLIILSSACYEILRALLDGILLIVVAVILFGLTFVTDPAGIAVALLALIGSLVLFASLGVGVAALTVLFKRAGGVVAALLAGIALLSGVYFPTDVLPPALQTLADILPFTWSLDVLRSALLGGEVDSLQLIGLIVAAVLLLPLALLGFRKSVDRARRTGTLAEY